MRIILLCGFVLTLYACSSGGGYYQDDGPPRNVPQEVLNTPDAVPRIEPLSATGNSPYTALGKTYYPVASARGYVATGSASWYGTKYHGRTTSSGEVYDMYKMTAAHPTLPLPSYVRVTNLQNRNSVVVKVNDRGPFLESRVIDLSYAAAAKLGILQSGTGQVEVRAVFPPGTQEQGQLSRGGSISAPIATAPGTSQSGLVSSAIISEPIDGSGTDEVQGSTGSTPGPVSDTLNDGPITNPAATAGTTAGEYLQVGVFGLAGNADSLLQTLRSRGFTSAGIWTREGAGGQTLYEVSIGPLPQWEKQELTDRLKNMGYQPFTVTK